MFSRVVYGARVSLPIGLVVVGVAILIGALLGAVAGFFGRRTDNIIMRLMDVAAGVPVAAAGHRHRDRSSGQGLDQRHRWPSSSSASRSTPASMRSAVLTTGRTTT